MRLYQIIEKNLDGSELDATSNPFTDPQNRNVETVLDAIKEASAEFLNHCRAINDGHYDSDDLFQAVAKKVGLEPSSDIEVYNAEV